jgi:hypothetical protein
MTKLNIKVSTQIPVGLSPYFQEYNLAALDISQDANLIVQRTLEFGDWDEVRWLFEIYGSGRIRAFVRQHGEKWLSPVVFNYWRKLLRIRTWRRTILSTPKGELWSH